MRPPRKYIYIICFRGCDGSIYPFFFCSMSDQVALENEKRAGADRDLAIKKAEYKAEVNQAEATAEVAFDIEKAKQGQTVSALPAKGRRLLCFFEKKIG